ncbi:hypothetical protein HNR64_002972 [Spongiibacter marinus]|nr:hypothetical protein [Spongiibacter marinus]
MPTNCDNVTTLPISPHSHFARLLPLNVGAGLTATKVSVGAVSTANGFTSPNPQHIHARTKTARPTTRRTNPVLFR